MKPASGTVVEYALRVSHEKTLSKHVKAIRGKYGGRFQNEVQLRELHDECQVIRFYHREFEAELKQFPYEDGAYVIARAKTWEELK